MRPFIFLFVVCLCVSAALSQHREKERLFCGSCGKQNELRFNYCFNCGTILDKAAVVDRLRLRLVVSDSSGQTIALYPDEFHVLVMTEAKAEASRRRRDGNEGVPLRHQPRTEGQKILDIIAPVSIAAGSIVILMMIMRSVL